MLSWEKYIFFVLSRRRRQYLLRKKGEVEINTSTVYVSDLVDGVASCFFIGK